MIKIKKLVRPNILALQPYSSARDEFTGDTGTFLDANENPYGKLNRYPDPYQSELKAKLAELKEVNTENIFIGNGSDEVIDLALRLFCEPGKDKALTFSPTYGMYDVSAAINNVELNKIRLTRDFQLDLQKLMPFLTDKTIKLIFICSPNNPTGNVILKKDIEFILNIFKGVVILDEAYIDFAEQSSLIKLIRQYDRLIVSQTFSKGWGLAAARVGVAYANSEIINFYNNVKPPYNISDLNQKAALKALGNQGRFKTNIQRILTEKKKVIKALSKLGFVKKIYPSDANFLLVEMANANEIYTYLIENEIVIRNRNQQVDNCVRISIGTPKENQKLIKVLKQIK
jgi:histidinol-phosphate aminotransferase